jgi:hypothetical protein
MQSWPSPGWPPDRWIGRIDQESVQGQESAPRARLRPPTIVEAARRAGGRLVVVDAIDNAARRFYQRHDFEPLSGDESRLVLKLSTAARALKLDWPGL